MKMRLCVDHEAGSAVLNSADPSDFRLAASALNVVALAEDPAVEVTVPSEQGPVSVRVGDIDLFDLTWEP